MTPALFGDDTIFETRAGLRCFVTVHGESAVFADFFTGYDRAFVLPDEKEDEVGFRRCLALNHGAVRADLERRYGPFREVCLVAYDAASQAHVGGANLIAMSHSGQTTANLNYIYIDPQARRQGNFRRLTQGVAELVQALFPAHTEAWIFIEQNDPFAMSADAYARDSNVSGIDQVDRLRIWAKAGARVVNFPYVQPPLSAAHGPEHSLLYSVYGSKADTLSAEILLGHLRCLFGVSVFKGASFEADPSVTAQFVALERMRAMGEAIALIDPAPLLEALANGWTARSGSERFESFRAALEAWGTQADRSQRVGPAHAT